MASVHLFRMGSVHPSRFLAALKHNKRTAISKYQTNIDVSRSRLNYSLHNDLTPQVIAKLARNRITDAGVRLRKNAVMAVEIIFSTPNNYHQRDTRPFFKDCYEWVKRTFAGELLSFDVHLDEAAPHAHALIMPLINGKMQGSALKGNRANVLRLNKLFSEEVAVRHGLHSIERKRLTYTDAKAIKQNVYMRLKSDPAMSSAVWPCIRDAIEKDPLPFAYALSKSGLGTADDVVERIAGLMTINAIGKDLTAVAIHS